MDVCVFCGKSDNDPDGTNPLGRLVALNPQNPGHYAHDGCAADEDRDRARDADDSEMYDPPDPAEA